MTIKQTSLNFGWPTPTLENYLRPMSVKEKKKRENGSLIKAEPKKALHFLTRKKFEAASKGKKGCLRIDEARIEHN